MEQKGHTNAKQIIFPEAACDRIVSDHLCLSGSLVYSCENLQLAKSYQTSHTCKMSVFHFEQSYVTFLDYLEDTLYFL